MDDDIRRSIEEKTGLRIGPPSRSDRRRYLVDLSARIMLVVVAGIVALAGLKLCAWIGGLGWLLMLPVIAAVYKACAIAGVTEEGLTATIGLLGLLGIIAGLIFGFTANVWHY